MKLFEIRYLFLHSIERQREKEKEKKKTKIKSFGSRFAEKNKIKKKSSN